MKQVWAVLLLTALLVIGGAVFGLTASAEAPAAQQPAEEEVDDCHQPADGWLIEVLQSVDRAKLAQAFANLEKHQDAAELLSTPEATTLRRIVETGKLPEASLEEWRKLERSPRTIGLVRALFALLRVDRYLTI